MDDFTLLGLENFTSLITKVEINRWGTNVVISCVYDPDERLPYQFIFNDCYKIEWTMLFPEDAGDLEADIFDFILGQSSHQHPALFHTDIFDLLIFYGSFEVKKDW